jgi:hypothetical protein
MEVQSPRRGTLARNLGVATTPARGDRERVGTARRRRPCRWREARYRPPGGGARPSVQTPKRRSYFTAFSHAYQLVWRETGPTRWSERAWRYARAGLGTGHAIRAPWRREPRYRAAAALGTEQRGPRYRARLSVQTPATPVWPIPSHAMVRRPSRVAANARPTLGVGALTATASLAPTRRGSAEAGPGSCRVGSTVARQEVPGRGEECGTAGPGSRLFSDAESVEALSSTALAGGRAAFDHAELRKAADDLESLALARGLETPMRGRGLGST